MTTRSGAVPVMREWVDWNGPSEWVLDHNAVVTYARCLEQALNEIAAWDDKGANERLAATGSYGAFDEPGSVQIARAALSGAQP